MTEPPDAVGHARLNRLDQYRQRLRRTNQDSGRRGPLVAKHPTSSLEANALKSAVQQHNSKTISSCVREDSPRRKRSPSLPRSRPGSPGNGPGSRPSSPSSLDPAYLEMVKRRVNRVQKARLYLLQQPGPNSFLVGGDSPEHKYRVVIGPQTCSCGRGPHCLHLLFVMFRVFQVPENDSRLYAKELKNFEVESLFEQYQERRISRVNGLPEDQLKRDLPLGSLTSELQTAPLPEGSSPTESDVPEEIKHNEEELCPICLLEMVDGESLVTCFTGCHNKLHHHCMAIWAAECVQQGDRVLCPLCRQLWPSKTPIKGTDRNGSSAGPRHHGLTSPGSPRWQHRTMNSIPVQPRSVKKPHYLPLGKPNGVSPKTSPSVPQLPEISCSIPPEQMAAAAEWNKVFGADLVSCLYSRDWKDRELAMERLLNEFVSVPHIDYDERQLRVMWCGAKILNILIEDPVFKVYMGCVQCFRLLMSNVSCYAVCQSEEFIDLIRPIIRTLLKKCADHNRRTSHLSVEVLTELVKSKKGGGLELILSCILEAFTIDSVGWQWLAGRLLMLSSLFKMFPQEFQLLYVPINDGESGYKLQNFNRLYSIIEFSFKALQSPHTTVNKLARHIFVLSASMTTMEKGVFNQILDMISELDSNLQVRLKKRLLAAMETQNCVPDEIQKSIKLGQNTNHNRLEANIGTNILKQSPIRPKDLPLELVTYKKQKNPKVFQCSSNIVTSPSKKWTHSSSKLTNLFFKSKKQEEIIPRVFTSDTECECIDHNKSSKTELGNITPSGDEAVAFIASDDQNCITDKLQSDDKVINNYDSSTMSTRSKKITASKFSSILFRNKRRHDITPNSLEFGKLYIWDNDHLYKQCCGSSRESSCFCGAIEEGNMSFLSKVMNDIPTTPSDSSPVYNSGTFFKESGPVFSVKRELEKVDNDTDPVETLVRPGSIGNSYETDNYGYIIKIKSYIEGIDWMRGPLLGTGAFSTCFQARDVASGTLMAVKQIPFLRNTMEEQIATEANIRKEVTVMSKLSHPNILQMLAATRQKNHFNIFVQWMAGGSIAGLLDMYGPFNQDVIIKYTKQVLRGLNYLHENHILHCDLKGANLLVDSTGKHLRIGDFGAAARLENQLTIAGDYKGQILGTISFMAPEVLRGEEYGRSCDIWSVGCCLIEMATTKPPWKENRMSNHLALMYRIASSKDPPIIPDNLCPSLQDIAVKCLQLKSELRPTAKELLAYDCFETNNFINTF